MHYDYVESFIYESRFWLEILREHTDFMLDSFSASEGRNIQITLDFNKKFDIYLNQILDMSNSDKNINKIYTMNNDIFAVVCSFLEFQQDIMKKRMLYEVKINMVPTFIEHMIREGKEFLRQLDYIKILSENENLSYVRLAMNQNKLWLPDAAGHAAYIGCGLDMSEKPLIQKAHMFERDFQDLFYKTYELKTILHPKYPKLPPVVYLSEQNTQKIDDFVIFLCHIKELIEEKKVMSMLSPLIPDHMQREEAYYISKLKIYMQKA